MESACKRLAIQIESEQREEGRITEIIQECDDKIKHFNEKLIEYQNLTAELKDTPEAEVLSEDYSAMLAEYRMYQESHSANLQELYRQLQKVQKSIGTKEKGIQRFHIEPTEYESTTYSDDAYHRAEEMSAQAQRNVIRLPNSIRLLWNVMLKPKAHLNRQRLSSQNCIPSFCHDQKWGRILNAV